MSVPAEVEDALAAEGMSDADVALISPLGARKGRRPTYRATSRDRTIKLRLLDSSQVAGELERLSAGLDGAFVPIVGRHGRVTVEPWIDGEALTGKADEVERAAEVLGRLHATTAAASLAPAAASRWLAAADSDLRLLHHADLVGELLAARVGRQLDELRRTMTTTCVIHRDFCPENLLVTGDGDIRVIDNEWLALGPPAYDLGRTLHRWTLDDDSWRRFLAAYSAVAGEPPELERWTLAAALFAARVAHERAPQQLDRALAMIEARAT